MNMAQQDLFIESEVMLITPQQAALWLEGCNLHNRPLSMARCQAMAGAISRGEWALNGDAIRFCTNGQLLDGQHRLQAIVLACKPIKTLVVRGLPPNSFATIDTNRAVRSARDVMALSGVPYYTFAAPIARQVHYLEQTGNPLEATSEFNPTADQLLEISRREGFERVCLRVSQLRWCRKFLSPALTGLCLYAFGNHRAQHAEDFFNLLESGAGLDATSPILLLRERLTSELAPGQRMRPVFKAALAFKAFRLYLLGTEVKQLKVVFSKNIPLKEHFVLDARKSELTDQR